MGPAAALATTPYATASIQRHPRLAGLLGGGVPFGLDTAESPDQQCDDPRDHEHADDDEPGRVDVEPPEERPERAAQVRLLADESQDLDRFR